MIRELPIYISLIFIFTTALTLWFLFKASRNSKFVLYSALALLALETVVSFTGFYRINNTLPPHFVFLILPPLILIVALFATSGGKKLIDSFDPKWMTYLHTVRIFVEITLLMLFLNKLIPQLMTFEGKNLDILSGLSAPLVAYLAYDKLKLNKTTLLIWNFICLGLLFNIVIIAILSAPTPFQQLAFEQPNLAILFLPFVWLPGFIVPSVMLSHIASIRQLLKK